MRKATLFFISLFFTFIGYAQQKLVYTMLPDTAALMRRMAVDSSSEDAAMKLQMKAFLLQLATKPEQFSYTLHDSVITMQKSTAPQMTWIYSARSLKIVARERKTNGTESVSVIDMDPKKLPGWHVRYEVKRFLSERKTIAGYDCYKLLVTETKTIDGTTYLRRIEMWVTGKIALPAFIVAGLYEMVVTECPLEIREFYESETVALGTQLLTSIE